MSRVVDLLSQAAEARRDGDHGLAAYLDGLAVVAMRAALRGAP